MKIYHHAPVVPGFYTPAREEGERAGGCVLVGGAVVGTGEGGPRVEKKRERPQERMILEEIF